MSEHQRTARDRAPAIEQISISSGKVFVLDQFLLGSSLFSEALTQLEDSSELSALIERFGGAVVDVESGTFDVHRNVDRRCVWLAPKGMDNEVPDFIEVAREVSTGSEPGVEVHSRCIVIGDLSLLSDEAQMKSFCELRARGREKDARDFLRAAGAAVRYGFDRFGEKLGVVSQKDDFPFGLYGDEPQPRDVETGNV